MVAHLTINLLHIVWRHIAITSNASEVWSKSSVGGISAMLVANLDSQLFLNTTLNPVVMDSIVFVD